MALTDKHDEEARQIALNYIGLFINNERSFVLQQEISTALAARDAEIERLTAERDRWQQDSMRQAATINRLSAATEDRNEVDILRHKAHEAEMALLRAQVERMREVINYAIECLPSEGQEAKRALVAAAAKEPHS